MALVGHARYKKGEYIAEGTFGVVYRGEDLNTGQLVAIKKLKILDGKGEGISPPSLREVKMLRELNHPNILGLIDVFSHHNTLHLIFELMETDLGNVIRNKDLILTAPDIKSFLHQTLSAIAYCHHSWILHRDVTPGNLLISPKGVLKLGDFGWARTYASPDPRYTSQVVTRWYRAPELLYGAKQYTHSVDIWAVGCIFAEMMLKTPYFPGHTDIDQLAKIFSALGTPTVEQWPGMTSLPDYVEFHPCPPTPFDQLFKAASEDALHLLGLMLRYDPNSRITADAALQHAFFRNAPAPTPNHLLPLPKSVLKRSAPPPEVEEFANKRAKVLFPD